MFYGVVGAFLAYIKDSHYLIIAPLQVASLRFLIAALSFLPVMIVLKISFKIPKNAIKGVILTTFFNVAYSVAFYIGIMLGNAGSAGVITTTLAPIFSSLIGAFIYNVTLNQAEKLGLFLGFIGGVFYLVGLVLCLIHIMLHSLEQLCCGGL